jgi:hypothetical protein
MSQNFAGGILRLLNMTHNLLAALSIMEMPGLYAQVSTNINRLAKLYESEKPGGLAYNSRRNMACREAFGTKSCIEPKPIVYYAIPCTRIVHVP